jgi:hypothetical protein
MTDSSQIELRFATPMLASQPLPSGGLSTAAAGVLVGLFALLAPMSTALRVVMLAMALAVLISAAGVLLLALPSRNGVLRLKMSEDAVAVVANPIRRQLDLGAVAALVAATPFATWLGFNARQPMDAFIGPVVLLLVGGVALSAVQKQGNLDARALTLADSGIGLGAQLFGWEDFDYAATGKQSNQIVLANAVTSDNQAHLDGLELASDRRLVIRLINFYRDNPAARAALSSGQLPEAISSGEAVSATPLA